MDIKDKYGYTPYDMDDPDMRYFIKAMKYLDIYSDLKRRTSVFNAVKRYLITNDLIDGEWKYADFKDLIKLPYAGLSTVTVTVVAQIIYHKGL